MPEFAKFSALYIRERFVLLVFSHDLALGVNNFMNVLLHGIVQSSQLSIEIK